MLCIGFCFSIRYQSWSLEQKTLYQTSHFFTGFMEVPSGQLKSRAKSFMFLKVPSTRNSDGECTPVVMQILRLSEKECSLKCMSSVIDYSYYHCDIWHTRIGWWISRTFGLAYNRGLAISARDHVLRSICDRLCRALCCRHYQQCFHPASWCHSAMRQKFELEICNAKNCCKKV